MTYRIIIGSPNTIGSGVLESVVELAKLGAVLEEGIVHRLNFPYHVQMILESEEAPTPTASIRVFDLETLEEVKVKQPEPKVAATFSTGIPTKEELDAMEWTELQDLARAAGITGKQRNKVTAAYLATFDK